MSTTKNTSRREAAAAAAAAEAPTIGKQRAMMFARKRDRRGEATPTDRRRIDEADAQKAGAKLRRREAALAVIETARALGLPDDDATGWRLAPTAQQRADGEPGDDARGVLDDVPVTRRRQLFRTNANGARVPVKDADGRPVYVLTGAGNPNAARYAVAPDRMPGRDLMALAWTAAGKVGRTPGLDRDDVASTLALKALGHFTGAAAPARCNLCGGPALTTVDLPDDYGNGYPAPRCIRHGAPMRARGYRVRHLPSVDATPRWDAIDREDVAPAEGRTGAVESAARRNAWRGWLTTSARNVVTDEHRTAGRNVAADWTPVDDDDAPTAEQLAAAAAERALDTYRTAVERTDPSTLDALAATAPGKPLSAAERDALLIGLAGLTRAEVAAVRGVDANAVKVGAQRGRRALAARVPDAAAAATWARTARKVDTDGADRIEAVHLPNVLAPLMAPPVPNYHAARLRWPDRDAPRDGGEAGHLPAWPGDVSATGGHGIGPAPDAPTWRTPHARPWVRVIGTRHLAHRLPVPADARGDAPHGAVYSPALRGPARREDAQARAARMRAYHADALTRAEHALTQAPADTLAATWAADWVAYHSGKLAA